jgi:hypothetical protein
MEMIFRFEREVRNEHCKNNFTFFLWHFTFVCGKPTRKAERGETKFLGIFDRGINGNFASLVGRIF